MAFLGLLRRGRYDRAGFGLYSAAVAAARDPYLYVTLGVPDTLDGRFDMIGLYAFLLIRRLQSLPEPGPALAQAVFDAMFSDMDQNLREMGVSDLSVGKRVRTMWEALHGRAQAYESALVAGDRTGLEAAIARNVWRGRSAPSGSAAALAALTQSQAEYLEGQALDRFAAGRAAFLPAEEASG